MAPCDAMPQFVELRGAAHAAARHRAPPQPEAGLVRTRGARGVGCRKSSTRSHGLYALPDDRLAKRAVVYGLERVAAAWSDGELVQNPEDVSCCASCGCPPRSCHARQRHRPDPVRPGPLRTRRAGLGRAEIGAGPGDVVVGVVGRLVAEKGIAEVLAAAAATSVRASSLSTKVHWALIGPTDDAKADAVGSVESIEPAPAACLFSAIGPTSTP